MNKFLILVIFLIIGASSVFAQQNPQITFPIAELGNCNNVQTCKVYCDQPENQDACKLFAKSKRIYKSNVDEKQAELLSLARTELGCTTITSCEEFCSQEVNYTHCQQFAQKHRLATPPSSAKDQALLESAKQNLGCDSFESCQALCDQQGNYTKCAALIQDQVTSDDRAMFEKYKPQIKEFLGCDSIVTCMAFCINPLNTAKCAELGSKIGGSEQPPQEPPEVWCPKVSSECRWDGTNCVCNGPESCAQNPECKWDGQNCMCGDIPSTEPPEIWCPKAGPECAWNGADCICPGTSETPIQTEAQEPGEVWCPKVGPYCVWDGSSCTCWDDCIKSGGTWTGSRCDFPQEQTTTQTPDQIYATPEPGEVWCPRNPDCTWTGEVCQCTPQPAVQGTTTHRGLLQQLLDFLLAL